MGSSARIHLVGVDGGAPELRDVSEFLYDLNVLYEVGLIIFAPEYAHVRVDRHIRYRGARRINAHDLLRVETLRVASPLDLNAWVTGIGAAAVGVWALVQSIREIGNLPSNWRRARLDEAKVRAELEKLLRENAEAAESSAKKQPILTLPEPPELRYRLRKREAEGAYEYVRTRVQNASIQIDELDVSTMHIDLREGDPSVEVDESPRRPRTKDPKR
jgi:hypothetical protein